MTKILTWENGIVRPDCMAVERATYLSDNATMTDIDEDKGLIAHLIRPARVLRPICLINTKGSDHITYHVEPGETAEHLPYAIKDCEDGDVIQVPSDTVRQLGRRAQQRLCPHKRIVFEVVKEG